MDHSKSDFTQGSILKKLQSHGMTIFMISHDVEFVAEYADTTGRLIYLLLEDLEQQQDFQQFLQEVKF